MISSHHGIFSLGLMSAIGSLIILIVAVIFLPAILELTESKRKERNSD
jgi:predicted RND superfamily exporter protein